MPQPAAPDSSHLDVVTAQVDVSISTLYDQIDRLVDGFIRLLPNLVIGILVFGVFVVVGRLVRKGVHRAWHGRRGDNVAIVLGRLAQAGILFTGLLVVMSIIVPSIGGAQLVQVLGVGGVAIGFAFRDILQNFLAGILLLLRRPFYLGDQIVYKDYEGTVEDIETRATVLRTYDGTRVFIPNGDLFTNSVRVQTAYEARRSEFDIGISYDDNVDLARRAFTEALHGLEGVLADPAPRVLFWGLDDSALTFRVWWWSRPDRATVVDTHDLVVTALFKAAQANGLTIPFPIRTVYLHNETAGADDPNGTSEPVRTDKPKQTPEPKRAGIAKRTAGPPPPGAAGAGDANGAEAGA